MDTVINEAPVVADALGHLPARAVLLHAGQHKTGSTAVQNAMAEAGQRLHEAGWLYPAAGRVNDADTGHRHRDMTMELLGQRGLQAWARLRQEIDRRDERILISHEGLFCPAITPERVAAELPGREVHVLVYLRHPVEYIESSFREWVRRWKLGVGLREWYQARRRWMQVDEMHARWTQAFGEGHVHLRAYRPERLLGGSVVSDFCAQIGLPPVPEGEGTPNQSLNTRQCLIHWVGNRNKADLAQCEALCDLVATPTLAGELLTQLDAMSRAAGFNAEQTAALARVLQGVQGSGRLMDDALAAQIEADCLPAYQAALAQAGQPVEAWPGAWRRQAFDDGLADEGLRRAVRVLLAR